MMWSGTQQANLKASEKRDVVSGPSLQELAGHPENASCDSGT